LLAQKNVTKEKSTHYRLFPALLGAVAGELNFMKFAAWFNTRAGCYQVKSTLNHCFEHQESFLCIYLNKSLRML